MSNPEKNRNWFERNPKKVIFFILLVAVGSMTWLTEKILARHSQYRIGTRRYIKMREPFPFYSEPLVPRDKFLANPGSPEAKKGYLYRADENGFLIPSKVYNHPDVLIVFLGGSTTECSSIKEECRFPYLVGRHLDDRLHLKVNSYNGGLACITSLNSINNLLNKVIPLKPEIVVMMHNVNDLSTLLHENTYWPASHHRSPIIVKPANLTTLLKNLEDCFHLARDLAVPNLSREIRRFYDRVAGPPAPPDEFARSRGRKIKVDKDHIVQEYRRNLQTFVKICQIRDITPVLMTMPNQLKENPDKPVLDDIEKGADSLGMNYRQYKECFDLFNETIRAVGVEEGAPVIDLAAAIPQEAGYFADFVHFNEAGSKLAAVIISDKLAPLVISTKNKTAGQ